MFANLDNPRTRRAYRPDVQDFTALAGVQRPEGMRQVTPSSISFFVPLLEVTMLIEHWEVRGPFFNKGHRDIRIGNITSSELGFVHFQVK